MALAMTVSGSLVQVNGWQRSFLPGVDEAADGGDEVGDGGKAAAAQRPASPDALNLTEEEAPSPPVW